MATNNFTNTSSGSSGTVLCTPSKPQSKLNTAQGHMAACVGETIEVTMGMFFDGTGNNKFNTDLGSRGSDDKESSYYNSYSNVARAWQYYKGSLNGVPLNNIQRSTDDEGHNFNIYIEGIGTKKGEKDSTIGFGLGQGAYGISTRVNEGSRKVADILEKEIDLNKVKEIKITFDVFGFSRGAAAARHFIHTNSERKKYYDNRTYNSFLHYWFNIKNYGYNSPKAVNININWRFAGLYETVSSHGGNRSDDVGELGLMNINHVENIFHIVAEDEYREKFSITPIQTPTIKNGKITPKTTRGTGTDNQGNTINTIRETYVMPGVHSDIGGGYAAPGTEKNNILVVSKSIEHNVIAYPFNAFNFKQVISNASEKGREELRRLKFLKSRFLRDGWYKEGQSFEFDKLKIVLEILRKQRGTSPALLSLKLIASRENIKNSYSHIPLHIMTEKAISVGVNFDTQLFSDYSFDSFLLRLKTNPRLSNAETLKRLRYEYLHWSSRYGATAGAHNPKFKENSRIKFEREIIPI